MKIAILGSRGIPNNYGGFEQFAQYLSSSLAEKGHEISVYNSHNHIYREKTWKQVNIIHCYNPEEKIGRTGQFVYDFNCLIDARKRNFDIILLLGYTSSSVFSFLFPKKKLIVTNMDGLEWKRTKYGKIAQKYLEYAENMAVKTSDHLIADSIRIQSYLREKYNKESKYIPYGTHIFNTPDQKKIEPFDVKPYSYNMLIARLEPENSIETILDGVRASQTKQPFLVIGSYQNTFGKYLVQKFKSEKRIVFLGSNYDLEALNNLRYFSNVYFHGHSVGGTNPSLLEAMGSEALICAHKNEFNYSILGEEAFYFIDKSDVATLLDLNLNKKDKSAYMQLNLQKVEKFYLWPKIANDYETYFESLFAEKKKSDSSQHLNTKMKSKYYNNIR